MLQRLLEKGGIAPAQFRSLLRRVVPEKLLSTLRLGVDALVYPTDFGDPERSLCERVSPFTLTSPERIIGWRNAIRDVIERGIEGSIVECGVWRGGSMMVAALTLIELGDTSRDLYLFDTFDGMSAPTEKDRSVWGTRATDLLSQTRKEGSSVWCAAGLEDVRANLHTVGYPEDRIHYVVGRVEDTLPSHAPPTIALLRLDTDWYESTYHELV